MIGTDYFWSRHEKIVYKECRAFQRKFGGEFEDILSDAYLGFARCLDRWQPDRAKFSTLLVRCVRNALYDRRRKQLREIHRGVVELPENTPQHKTSSLWERLSEDAALIASALLIRGKHKRQRRIEAITALGLPGGRIAEGLHEIKEALLT